MQTQKPKQMEFKRDRLVIGNWKMHTNVEEGCALVDNLLARLRPRADLKVVLVPPYTHLYAIAQRLQNSPFAIELGAQNCAKALSGAYTGEISTKMLKELNVRYVLVGHSERRQFFQEKNEDILEKIACIHAVGLRPIVCCGEPLKARESNAHKAYVGAQIQSILKGFARPKAHPLTVAYEPVWAIGTGRSASAEDAQAMHAHLRAIIQQELGEEIAQKSAILYGGSVKSHNIDTLIAQTDIDGVLVGGASLSISEFAAIVAAC